MNKTITIYLDESAYKWIEEKRGLVNRSTFMKFIIHKLMEEDAE